jgi:hypothetical protein
MIPVVSAISIITDGSTSTQAEALWGNCAKNQDGTGIPKKDSETGTVGACTCKSMIHAISANTDLESYKQNYVCGWTHVIPFTSTDTVVFSLSNMDKGKAMYVEVTMWVTDHDAFAAPTLNRRLLQLPESSFVEDGHDASRRALSTSAQPSLPFVDSVKETPLAPLASTVKKSGAFRILAPAANQDNPTEAPTVAPTDMTTVIDPAPSPPSLEFAGCPYAVENPSMVDGSWAEKARVRIECLDFRTWGNANQWFEDGGKITFGSFMTTESLFEWSVWKFQVSTILGNPFHIFYLALIFAIWTMCGLWKERYGTKRMTCLGMTFFVVDCYAFLHLGFYGFTSLGAFLFEWYATHHRDGYQGVDTEVPDSFDYVHSGLHRQKYTMRLICHKKTTSDNIVIAIYVLFQVGMMLFASWFGLIGWYANLLFFVARLALEWHTHRKNVTRNTSNLNNFEYQGLVKSKARNSGSDHFSIDEF